MNIENRLNRLESLAGNGRKVSVWARLGETPEDAIRRLGYDPDDRSIAFRIRMWKPIAPQMAV